jgi:NAD(P)H dehydrogenase (quinone)
MGSILVTGASGQYGRGIINHLLTTLSPSQINVLVRDPAKVADLKASGVGVRAGSYDDPASLVSAFRDVDRLFFVSASDLEKRTGQHKNVVAAATKAGVRHVVYSSFQRKDETPSSPIAFVAEAHLRTEEWLRASGMTYTFLRNTLYMHMLPLFMGDQLVATGTLYLPAGEGKGAYMTREDMAEIGARVVAASGHENKEYDVSGATAVTFMEIAAMVSAASGKPIRFVSPPVEEFRKTLLGAGVPEMMVNLAGAFAVAIARGEFEKTNPRVDALLGRSPVSVAQYIQTVYGGRAK